MKRILKWVYIIVSVAILTTGLTTTALANEGGGPCSQQCCWNWFWGWESTCSATCPAGTRCSCTCDCSSCLCTCVQA
jgi:hypothetical protein